LNVGVKMSPFVHKSRFSRISTARNNQSEMWLFPYRTPREGVSYGKWHVERIRFITLPSTVTTYMKKQGNRICCNCIIGYTLHTLHMRGDIARIIRKSGVYPYNIEILKRKNFLSLTPLTTARKFFNLALNDSADALVLRFLK
jgi:hypothetical protein